MEYVRLGAYGVGFVCRMRPGGCKGTVTVTYGGRVCGTLTVTNPMMNYVGSVVGPDVMESGESAIFYHNLGIGATYTGSLPGTSFENELGNGVVCTMPGSPAPTYTVSFKGLCSAAASKSVSSIAGLIGVISFSARSSTGSLTHEAIGAGTYYTENNSWVDLWGDGNRYSDVSSRLTYSVSGNTLTVHFEDDPYRDNLGSISISVYRSE